MRGKAPILKLSGKSSRLGLPVSKASFWLSQFPSQLLPFLMQTIKWALGEGGCSCCQMRTFSRQGRVPQKSVLYFYRGLMFSTFPNLSFVIEEVNKEVLNHSKQSPARLGLEPRKSICTAEEQRVPTSRNSQFSLFN